MNVGVWFVVLGLLCAAGAAVWLFGAWGLGAAGLGLIVAGLVPDWSRVHAINSGPVKK